MPAPHSILSALALIALVASSFTTAAPVAGGCNVPNSAFTSVFETTNSGYFPYLSAAAAEFGLCTDARMAAFLGTISHETARLTIFQQPADGGAGAIHMIPSNWPQAFSDLGLAKGSHEQMLAIMLDPKTMFRVAGWWFTKGAGKIMGTRCNNFGALADGLVAGDFTSGNNFNILNTMNTCVFGGGYDMGLPQRLSLIAKAYAGIKAGGGVGGGSSPAPAPQPQPTYTPKPTVAPQPQPTVAPQPTYTPKPTMAPQPTVAPQPQPTVAPQPTAVPTQQPTVAPQPQPTVAPQPQPTVTPQPKPTRTHTRIYTRPTVIVTKTTDGPAPTSTPTHPNGPQKPVKDLPTTPTQAPSTEGACGGSVNGSMQCAASGALRQCVNGAWYEFPKPAGTKCQVVDGNAMYYFEAQSYEAAQKDGDDGQWRS
ncbi:hypothetical protein GGF32_009269 [Allomyces javanicus]|nr:hypothetical protein GGF32_009269 [Allomyces javanicus]